MLFTDNREDREVIEMVNRHHRLNTTTSQTIGYFVPEEEAQRIAVQRVTAQRNAGSPLGVAMIWLVTMLAAVLATVGLLG